MKTSRERLERFLNHLDKIFPIEPEFFSFDSLLPDAPKLGCLVYRDVPENGLITGVTYGLSEVPHPEWRFGRAELTITVESNDVAWPLAIAGVANTLRGKCPFSYGELINFDRQIAEESAMSAFFVFAPSILERDEFLNIDTGGEQPVNIAGLYPIYASEMRVIREVGLEHFWKHPKFDLYDVHRPPVKIELS